MNAIGPYLKALAAILGAVTTSLIVVYPGARWLPVLTAAVTAVNVYLTPNLPKVPPSNADIPTQPMAAVKKDTADNPFGGNS